MPNQHHILQCFIHYQRVSIKCVLTTTTVLFLFSGCVFFSLAIAEQNQTAIEKTQAIKPLILNETSQYQLKTDLLHQHGFELNIHFNGASQSLPGQFARGWRHYFSHTLLQQNGSLVIIDDKGELLYFRKNKQLDNQISETTDKPVKHSATTEQLYQADNPIHGSITLHGNTAIWQNSNIEDAVFKGSLLTSIRVINGNHYTLQYHDFLLSSVTDQNHNTISFNYNENGQLIKLLSSDLTQVSFSIDHQQHLLSMRGQNNLTTEFEYAMGAQNTPSPYYSESRNRSLFTPQADTAQSHYFKALSKTTSTPVECPDENQLCEQSGDNGTPLFNSSVSIPDAIQLDVRPTSCASFFEEYYGTERGSQIEDHFYFHQRYSNDLNTIRIFPVVDYLHGTEARVIISRDVTAQSYQADNALYERLIMDAQKIEDKLTVPLQENGSIAAMELGSTTQLYKDDVDTIVLELVVQHGMTSLDQQRQIAAAREELLARWGVILKVIEIP